MKRILNIILSIALLAGAVSCSKDNPEVKAGLAGEWKLVSWNGSTPDAYTIYLELLSDGSFNLYEKYQTSSYERRIGTFDSAGDVLKGKYSDGTPWGADYDFELSGDVLTLTSSTDISVVSIYKRSTIPDEVRNAPVTKTPAEGGLKVL